MKTTASIFSGGELVGVGARAAGFEHLWGIEYVDEIAQAARNNGFSVTTADVRGVDPTTLQRPDHLHASPPCPSFSNAKNGAEETREDVELAEATVRFVEALLPRWFTLENVSMYRFSESWRLIQNALDRLGYWMDVQNHLNMADWGVPQTRKRMIVRAIRGGFLPPLPPPEPWRGWYQAIEDLIPGLPDSKFADWQLEGGVLERLMASLLVDSAGYPDDTGARVPVMRGMDEPANTIVANHGRRPMRAFLATSQYAQPSGTPDRECQARNDSEPSPTVTASIKGDWRAFIVDSCNAGRTQPTIRASGEPVFTVVANVGDKGMPRAAVPGRVVKMTERALARLQSIRDDYILPENATLAVRIVGNAVPPLFMQKLLQPFVI